MLRGKQRGQSVVEFGIVAILFTLILFAIADFGLLLNDWLSVSSTTRQLGRDAAVGMHSCSPTECPPTQAELWNEATSLKIPGVAADPYFTATPGYCCAVKNPAVPGDHGAAVQLSVTYYLDCTPPVSNCHAVDNTTRANLDNRFTSSDPTNPSTRYHGGCTPTPGPCAHPAAPSASSPGDVVVLTLTAAGAQVITPLVRPFFSGPACTSSGPCYVSLSTTITMRFEGDTVL